MQLLEVREDLVLDEFLAFGRGFVIGITRLPKGVDGLVLRETLENVDEDGVRLGNVETDVGDVVGDEAVHHGED